MARHKSKTRDDQDSAHDPSNDPAQAIRDSAQKIWLAGLGAFERAKTEGPRVFENLVEQGRTMGARAMGAADETLKQMREGNYNAAGGFEKLEKMLEQGVSRSLKGLGVMTTRDVEELSRQVRDLNETVRSMMSGAARSAAGAAASASGATRPGRKSSSRKSGGSKRASGSRKASAGRGKAASGAKASSARSTTRRKAGARASSRKG